MWGTQLLVSLVPHTSFEKGICTGFHIWVVQFYLFRMYFLLVRSSSWYISMIFISVRIQTILAFTISFDSMDFSVFPEFRDDILGYDLVHDWWNNTGGSEHRL